VGVAKRVLDTNVLINHWVRSLRGRRLRDMTRAHALAAADRLRELQGSAFILTPIYLEYVCGQRNRHELELARAYVGRFEIADGGNILRQDWDYARRLAERVPRDGLPRQLGDCLIRAVCERLHFEYVTLEIRFPHRLTGPPLP
jgi:predicted nucleic acid-binding protein